MFTVICVPMDQCQIVEDVRLEQIPWNMPMHTPGSDKQILERCRDQKVADGMPLLLQWRVVPLYWYATHLKTCGSAVTAIWLYEYANFRLILDMYCFKSFIFIFISLICL